MKVLSATANVTGEKFLIDRYGKHVFACNSDIDLGGGTLSLVLKDNATDEVLHVSTADYQFTAAFQPFEVLLAPGMAVQFTLAGATAPDVEVFMYPAES